MGSGGGGDWLPLYISLGILFVLGGLIPILISGFVPDGEYNNEAFITPIRDFVENGIDIDLPLVPDITFSPFGWFGDDIQEYIVDKYNAFTYVPDLIAIPLLIIMLIGFFYTIIKLLPFT